MKDISCDVIRDLIPLYIDDICSEQSKRLIEDHIDECENFGELFSKAVNIIESKGIKNG